MLNISMKISPDHHHRWLLQANLKLSLHSQHLWVYENDWEMRHSTPMSTSHPHINNFQAHGNSWYRQLAYVFPQTLSTTVYLELTWKCPFTPRTALNSFYQESSNGMNSQPCSVSKPHVATLSTYDNLSDELVGLVLGYSSDIAALCKEGNIILDVYHSNGHCGCRASRQDGRVSSNHGNFVDRRLLKVQGDNGSDHTRLGIASEPAVNSWLCFDLCTLKDRDGVVYIKFCWQ